MRKSVLLVLCLLVMTSVIAVEEEAPRPKRRYRFKRVEESDELTIEPIEERTAPSELRVRVEDEEEEDCGCRGEGSKKGSPFGR